MSGPRIPSLLIGGLLCLIGGAYLLDSGPTGPTALVLLIVGLGVAALLALLHRRSGNGPSPPPPDAPRPPGA